MRCEPESSIARSEAQPILAVLTSLATKRPAQGGAGSKRRVLGWRVVGRKRGPSGDLTPETRIGPDTTRSWPVPRSHPRKRGPCSTFHRPPGAGQESARNCAFLTHAFTVASPETGAPAPRSGASPILAATLRGWREFWPMALSPSICLMRAKRRVRLRALSQNRASASRVSWC